MYIECNFSWTHGGHFFNSSSKEDNAVLDYWRSKNSKYYDNAMYTWTVRDVAKRECAKRNHLNYVVFWTIDSMHSSLHQMGLALITS